MPSASQSAPRRGSPLSLPTVQRPALRTVQRLPGLAAQKNLEFWRQALPNQASLHPSGLVYPLLRRLPPLAMPRQWSKTQALFK